MATAGFALQAHPSPLPMGHKPTLRAPVPARNARTYEVRFTVFASRLHGRAENGCGTRSKIPLLFKGAINPAPWRFRPEIRDCQSSFLGANNVKAP
jgi:hypothetical protein